MNYTVFAYILVKYKNISHYPLMNVSTSKKKKKKNLTIALDKRKPGSEAYVLMSHRSATSGTSVNA